IAHVRVRPLRVLKCSRKYLARKSHNFLIPLITLLKLWLTLSNKTYDFYGSSPRVLNTRSILDLKHQSFQRFSGLRVDVVAIDIVNSAIASVLWVLYVVILVNIIAPLMSESCPMKGLAEIV